LVTCTETFFLSVVLLPETVRETPARVDRRGELTREPFSPIPDYRWSMDDDPATKNNRSPFVTVLASIIRSVIAYTERQWRPTFHSVRTVPKWKLLASRILPKSPGALNFWPTDGLSFLPFTTQVAPSRIEHHVIHGKRGGVHVQTCTEFINRPRFLPQLANSLRAVLYIYIYI